MKVEVLQKKRVARSTSDKKITFEQQETEEIKNRLRAAVQHGDHAHVDLRVGNMDILKRARENDQISTTKNVSPHCPVAKEMQEKVGKRRTLMRGQRMTMTKRKTRKNIVTQKMKQKKGQRQTQIAVKTATCPSRRTSTK